MISLEGLSL